MTELNILVNSAYVLLLLSYLMRDILWLRVITVLSILVLIPYYYFLPQTLWPPIAWNTALMLINVYWIVRLLIERRPVRFTPQERRLYETALRRLRPRDARKLFQAGTWKSVNLGAGIATQGEPLNELSLISSGQVRVERDGIIVDEIDEGRFVGSYNFLKRREGSCAPVTFAAATPSRLLVWQNDALRKLIEGDTELCAGVEATLGLELAHLLDHSMSDLKLAQLFERWAPPQRAAG